MMPSVIARAFDLVRPCDEAGDAWGIGAAFLRELQPLGAKALYARACEMGRGGPARSLARISPAGWEETYQREGLGEANVLERMAFRRNDPFSWREAIGDASHGRRLLELLGAHGFRDGVAIPCHGAGGYIGVVSLAIDEPAALSPDEHAAIGLAAIIVHDRIRALDPGPKTVVALTPRERDCLAFVAAGKSDWEISRILGIAHSTARGYVESARVKIDARTRAQATARAIAMGLI